jgi:hypothetical protein
VDGFIASRRGQTYITSKSKERQLLQITGCRKFSTGLSKDH